MTLGQADRPEQEPGSEGVQSREVPRSSENVEAAFVRSLSRGREKSTNHAGGRAASLTRGWAWCSSSDERHAPPKPQCAGQELRLLPLPPGKAQAACCRLCVAPRTLSFKSSSGMYGLVSSILPQSHVALRKNSETTETADPALAASRWGRLARQLGCLSPPTSEAKKDPHPDL